VASRPSCVERNDRNGSAPDAAMVGGRTPATPPRAVSAPWPEPQAEVEALATPGPGCGSPGRRWLPIGDRLRLASSRCVTAPAESSLAVNPALGGATAAAGTAVAGRTGRPVSRSSRGCARTAGAADGRAWWPTTSRSDIDCEDAATDGAALTGIPPDDARAPAAERSPITTPARPRVDGAPTAAAAPPLGAIPQREPSTDPARAMATVGALSSVAPGERRWPESVPATADPRVRDSGKRRTMPCVILVDGASGFDGLAVLGRATAFG
jgi:hypothetical protein